MCRASQPVRPSRRALCRCWKSASVTSASDACQGRLLGLSALLRRLFGGREEEPAEEEESDVDPFDPFPEPVRLEITDVFDLHSVPPREVRAGVERYLNAALR